MQIFIDLTLHSQYLKLLRPIIILKEQPGGVYRIAWIMS